MVTLVQPTPVQAPHFLVRGTDEDAVDPVDEAIVVSEHRAALLRQASRLAKRYGQPALVEEYIDGREFTVLVESGRFDVLLGAFEKSEAGRGGQTGDVRWDARDELRLLVTHGVLHVCGWDHAEPAEEREMRALERQLLGLG